MLHLSQAEGDFILPDHVPEHVLFISGGSGITPVMSMLRSLQRRTAPRPGHLPALRAEPRPPDLRRRARRDPALGPRHRRSTCCTPSSATRTCRRRASSGWCPATATYRTWACGPAPTDRGRPRGVRRVRRAAHRVLQAARASRRQLRRGRRRLRRAPARRRANTGAPLLEQAEALGLTPGVRLPDGHLLLLHLAQDARAPSATSSPARSPRCPTRTSASASPPPSATASSTSDPSTKGAAP